MSFEGLKNWLSDIKENKGDDIKLAIVGNKMDLEDKRMISKGDGLTFADEHKSIFMEISAKTGENIELLFHNIITPIIDAKVSLPPKEPKSIY